MKKLARIQAINVQIAEIDDVVEQAERELSMLDHINDDAQRDALVSSTYDDRADARMTEADVDRISNHIASLGRSRDKLVAKRDELIAKLVVQ